MMASRSQNSYVIMLLASMVISGTFVTLDNKFQNQQFVQEGRLTKYFYHPFMQTFCIYVATTLALPIFFLQKKMNPELHASKLEQAKKEGKIIEFSRGIILVCAVCNIIIDTFQFVSLIFISSSVYQITRGGTIATTFIFSTIYLKFKPKKYQFIGSTLTMVGVIIVGISNFIYQKSTSEQGGSDYQQIGYILLLFAVLLQGVAFTFEQSLLRKYHLSPIQLVGYEGLFAIGIYSVILVCLTFSPCSFGEKACAYFNERPFMERPDVYLKELGDHYPLLITTLIQTIALLIFYTSCLSITKQTSSIYRTICDATRTVIIWAVGIIVTVTAGKYQANYIWESTEAGAIGMQLAGFAIVVVGNFLYSKTIVLPCLSEEEEVQEQKGYCSLEENVQEVNGTDL